MNYFKETEGNGIGLATCKKIVEQHKGEIFIQSEINEGSIFTIVIPHSLNKNEIPYKIPKVLNKTSFAHI